MDWLEQSRALLRTASTPWGIKASLMAKDNYNAIFTRDAVIAGIAGILLQDNIIIEGLSNTLTHLKQLQGSQGQITSNFKVKNNEIVDVSYGTLSPKIDSCTWYLIGVGLMIKEGHVEKEIFKKSITKTIDLLDGIEYNGKHLMYIPKGGNWADEYIYEGYILYDQVLRAWGLALLGSVYGEKKWSNKSKEIVDTIIQSYKNEDKEYYNSSFYPGGVFDKFDLAAHTVIGVVFDDKNEFYSNTLNWISKTFIEKGQLPTAFFPVIEETSSEWEELSKYFLFRFKNKPHHFHNGGIWWVWLGWLSISFSLWNKNQALEQLIDMSMKYLEDNKSQFEFDEYIASDDLKPNGTKKLVYTASGIVFLSLARDGFDFSVLKSSLKSYIIEPYTIKKEYFRLSTNLIDVLGKTSLLNRKKLVIGIAGESGSGKSTSAKCLQIALEKLNINAIIIHQDGYYKLPPKENHSRRKKDISWVGVNELELERMQYHIDQFKAGDEVIEIPIVNYKMNKFTLNKVLLKEVTILIVEGVYTFFLENIDHKIFMSNTYKDTINKRKKRSREEYDPFVEQVLEIEHTIVSKQINLSDTIVTKDYQIEICH